MALPLEEFHPLRGAVKTSPRAMHRRPAPLLKACEAGAIRLHQEKRRACSRKLPPPAVERGHEVWLDGNQPGLGAGLEATLHRLQQRSVDGAGDTRRSAAAAVEPDLPPFAALAVNSCEAVAREGPLLLATDKDACAGHEDIPDEMVREHHGDVGAFFL